MHLPAVTVPPPAPSNARALLQLLEEASTVSGIQQASNGSSAHTEVWTCGQNSYGELCLGGRDTGGRQRHSLVCKLSGRGVVDVAAGNEHTVVLCSNGDVLTAGYNDNGQCGHGDKQRIANLTPIASLSEANMGARCTQVHSYNGCEHSFAVLADGRLASFGYNCRGQLGVGTTSSETVPRLVSGGGLAGHQVKDVACSYYHSIVTCTDGAVYAFGRNDFGQLGLGDVSDRVTPTRVQLPVAEAHTGVSSIACGQYHTLLTTCNGAVLVCGKNDYGQLGLDGGTTGARACKALTRVGGALANERAVAVRCGYYHSLVLTEGGEVFGFGRNDYGQLGLGHAMQSIAAPSCIRGLDGKGVVQLAAGCYHTVFVAGSGMLYVCGRNNHGQLGTGDAAERHSPYPLDIFLGKQVAKIAAGFYHTVII
ncbi:regulator of chromosome condensation 1/beta-lactamase-inhibitor protein II, partial [Tribonema minus]